MIIERNPAKEELLLNALKESFDEPRTGVHLSDLMSVRQSYYKRIMPLPIDETQVGYFASGRALEDVVARLIGIDVGAVEARVMKVPGLVAGEQRYYLDGKTYPVSKKGVPAGGISYRPDFRWNKTPVEFKSRRAGFAAPGQEADKYDHYLEQLKGYCCFDKTTQGGLYLFDIGGGCTPALGHRDYYSRTPSFAFYDVVFRDEELQAMEAILIQRRDMFTGALEKGGVKDGWALPLCPPWMCGKNKKTVTVPSKCAVEGCEVKHRTVKPPHIMSEEVAEWNYIPRCPHYAFSKPQMIDASRGSR